MEAALFGSSEDEGNESNHRAAGDQKTAPGPSQAPADAIPDMKRTVRCLPADMHFVQCMVQKPFPSCGLTCA